MRYYEATSAIAASPEAVWAVLSDGVSWPRWDSGVNAAEGRIAMNETIKIRSQAAPGLGPSFQRFARGLKQQRVESGG